MKKYFARITENCSKIELIYWWLLRLPMIYGIIRSLIFGDEYLGSSQPLQMTANLIGMFAYEIIQLLPKNNRLRFFSPYFQNITCLGFFLGSFCGAFLNWYYIVPGFDKALHAFGTAEAVFIGYEYIAATQKKYKTVCHPSIAVLCALGLGFVLSTAWELFEFTYDQFFGGDAQHWSYENALAAVGGDPEKVFHLFDPVHPERFALMDTMGDIVMNFCGGLPMYLILSIKPYLHRGKHNVNREIEQALREAEAQKKAEPSTETVPA